MKFWKSMLSRLFASPVTHTQAASSDEEAVGLHVYSDYGQRHILVSTAPSRSIITATVEELDWQSFHQVVIVNSAGESLEVGGSLDPSDGLSASYRHQENMLVTENPPASIDELVRVLVSFHLGDDQWKERAVFT